MRDYKFSYTGFFCSYLSFHLLLLHRQKQQPHLLKLIENFDSLACSLLDCKHFTSRYWLAAQWSEPSRNSWTLKNFYARSSLGPIYSVLIIFWAFLRPPTIFVIDLWCAGQGLSHVWFALFGALFSWEGYLFDFFTNLLKLLWKSSRLSKLYLVSTRVNCKHVIHLVLLRVSKCRMGSILKAF